MHEASAPDFRALFEDAERGQPGAAAALFTALYSELHKTASRELSRNGWGVSLGATSLLHEAYIDLSRKSGAAFPDRNRFMAYAAKVMRGLIVNYARNRQAQKRGGHFEFTTVELDTVDAASRPAELVRICEALDDLGGVDPTLAEVVDLKYFCGFSFEEIAAMKGLSERTVRRQWTKARAYLYESLRDAAPTA